MSVNDSPSVTPYADDEEAAWYSLWRRSRAFRNAGQDEQFVRTALVAFQLLQPHRAKPLHDLAGYCLGKWRGDIAIVYAHAGMALPLSEQDRLGVEEDVYRVRLKEAFTIAASYSKDPDDKERGRVICNWLSMNKALPHWTRVLARQNSRWYAELWCLSCMRQLNEEGRADMVLAGIAKGPQGHYVFTDWRILASGRPRQWKTGRLKPRMVSEKPVR
jgi:hypothetical protein